MVTLRIVAVVCLLIGGLNAQDYGRLQSPDTEKMTEIGQPPEASRQIFALEKEIDPKTYILGPGDEIGLNILMRETRTFPLTVTPTGDLFIPSVGVCHVSGLTLESAIAKVQEFIKIQAYPQAQANMVLLNMREFKILVSGAVEKPGFINITPTTRLDEVITLVDGFHQLAKEFEIKVLRREGKVEIHNFHRFLLEGDLESNPMFLEGDQILVPFGAVVDNGIVVRGSIEGAGYDIISSGEILGDYIKRQVVFQKNADLQNVTITRSNGKVTNHLIVNPKEFDSMVLKAGDVINFMWERGITVTGYVQAPGGFSFFPGYSVSDYVALAGGNSPNGNPKSVSVKHLDGSTERGDEVLIMRGDVIYVPRTTKDAFVGDSSILQILVALTTVYLAYLATI